MGICCCLSGVTFFLKMKVILFLDLLKATKVLIRIWDTLGFCESDKEVCI